MNEEMRKKYEEKIEKLTKIQDEMLKLFNDLNQLFLDYQKVEGMIINDLDLIEWYKEYAKQYKNISELINNFDDLFNRLTDMKILKSKDVIGKDDLNQ